MHVGFLHFAPTLAMIAVRTCRNNIRPSMLTAHMSRNHMVNCQTVIALSAILTGIIVTTKYLTPCQLDAWSRTMDLHLQPNDRGPRQQLIHCFYVTASID